ncbi:hypothetical protein IAR50_003348 [Cryptococcus sp. DSM 104548]
MDHADISRYLLTSLIASPSNIYPGSVPFAAQPKAKLSLIDYAGSRRLRDAFYSVLTVQGQEKRLIAKVVCPGIYDNGRDYTKDPFDNSEAAVHIELMEDVGQPVVKHGQLRFLPLQGRRMLGIQDLYRPTYAARVLHRDLEPRHICRRADGRFALIDFDSSCLVEDGLKGDQRLASEARRVAPMLGSQDHAMGTVRTDRPSKAITTDLDLHLDLDPSFPSPLTQDQASCPSKTSTLEAESSMGDGGEYCYEMARD